MAALKVSEANVCVTSVLWVNTDCNVYNISFKLEYLLFNCLWTKIIHTGRYLMIAISKVYVLDVAFDIRFSEHINSVHV